MTNKRVNRRFARESENERVVLQLAATIELNDLPFPPLDFRLKPSRVKYCRKLATHKIPEAMPEVVDRLVEEALNGSIKAAHVFLKARLCRAGLGHPAAAQTQGQKHYPAPAQ